MHPAMAFTNPVHDGYFADPFVLRHDSWYYAYGTNGVATASHAFEVLRSRDLVHWESRGRVLAPVDGLAPEHHWAPEVAYHDGLFYMYFSAGVEDRDHRVRVAVGDRPDGTFCYSGTVLTPDERFAIDASPFRDEDGRWYLYYARDVLDGDRVGTSLAVDRLISMDRLAGEPVPVLWPTADWQLFRRQRPMYGAIYDWHTLEAPFVVKRMTRYWCFYSGGPWTTADYGVSYAVADSPLGPFVEPPTDGPALLRTRPGALIGPGHNSLVEGPDGADYIVYHAWDPEFGARRMCIDRIEWTADGPRTAGPTAEPQLVPSPLGQAFSSASQPRTEMTTDIAASRSPNVAQEVSTLYRDGIVGAKALFDRAWVDHLRRDMEAAYAEAIARPGGAVGRGPQRWYVEVHPEDIDGFPDLVTNPWIMAMSEAVLGPHYRFVEVGFDVPFQGAKNQPWHRDFASPVETHRDRRLTSLAFNLTGVDVTRDMGPFEIALGTQWEPGIEWRHGMFPPRDEWSRFASVAQRKFPQRGDVSCRTALTIHRGTEHASSVSRPVLILGVVAAEVANPAEHDLELSRTYYDSLSPAAREHLLCRVVDELAPIVQRHDIEGLVMGVEQ